MQMEYLNFAIYNLSSQEWLYADQVNGPIFSMTLANDKIYVGGSFTSAGNLTYSMITGCSLSGVFVDPLITRVTSKMTNYHKRNKDTAFSGLYQQKTPCMQRVFCWYKPENAVPFLICFNLHSDIIDAMV